MLKLINLKNLYLDKILYFCSPILVQTHKAEKNVRNS